MLTLPLPTAFSSPQQDCVQAARVRRPFWLLALLQSQLPSPEHITTFRTDSFRVSRSKRSLSPTVCCPLLRGCSDKPPPGKCLAASSPSLSSNGGARCREEGEWLAPATQRGYISPAISALICAHITAHAHREAHLVVSCASVHRPIRASSLFAFYTSRSDPKPT